ncbi:MAG: glycosyltransferase [Clostridia bacterium]|nr:glycosyltransferase [Clostridia bacterium]
MKNFSVTIIVGAANESDSLIKTGEAILHLCKAEDIDKIIFVMPQNAARECSQAIDELKEKHPSCVMGLVQKRPYVGGAIQDGFDLATSSHIMLLPGDLAVDLHVVPRLIEEEKKNPQGIVKVSRWLKKDGFIHYSPTRKVLNGCAQSFLRVLYHTKLTDLTNPVQIMPTALYRAIDWKELNFPFLTEMVLCPLKMAVPIKEIPAAGYGNAQGHSNNSFLQTALYLKTALRIRFTKPAKLLKQTER